MQNGPDQLPATQVTDAPQEAPCDAFYQYDCGDVVVEIVVTVRPKPPDVSDTSKH